MILRYNRFIKHYSYAEELFEDRLAKPVSQ
jgi:hypothetical protein